MILVGLLEEWPSHSSLLLLYPALSAAFRVKQEGKFVLSQLSSPLTHHATFSMKWYECACVCAHVLLDDWTVFVWKKKWPSWNIPEEQRRKWNRSVGLTGFWSEGKKEVTGEQCGVLDPSLGGWWATWGWRANGLNFLTQQFGRTQLTPDEMPCVIKSRYNQRKAQSCDGSNWDFQTRVVEVIHWGCRGQSGILVFTQVFAQPLGSLVPNLPDLVQYF